MRLFKKKEKKDWDEEKKENATITKEQAYEIYELGLYHGKHVAEIGKKEYKQIAKILKDMGFGK